MITLDLNLGRNYGNSVKDKGGNCGNNVRDVEGNCGTTIKSKCDSAAVADQP